MVSQDRQPKPEGWEEISLDECSRFLKTANNSRDHLTYNPNKGNIRYLHYGDIHKASSSIWIAADRHSPFLKSQHRVFGNILETGDLVFVDASEDIESIGKAVEVVINQRSSAIAGLHTIALRLDNRIFANGYKQYLQFHPILRSHLIKMSSGTKVYATNKSHIKEIKISLPPLEEQEAIARVLSNADQLIRATEELIEKKKKIKKSLMQELLTGKTRLLGFSGEWEGVALGDVASFQKGKGLGKKDLVRDGKMPCVHYGQLFTKYNEVIQTGEIISKTNLSGDVVLSKVNDVLMPTSDVTPKGLATASAIQEDGVIIGGDVLVIRSDSKKVLGDFLSRIIRMDKNQILDLATGTTVFHIYASDMKRFTLQLPTLEEQKAIARVLFGADQEIGLLEEKLVKYKKIKQGMMQELLTGKTRLPEFRR